MGDVRQTVSGRNGVLHDLSETAVAGLAKKAALWAEAKRHPSAVAVAMIDPAAEIVEASDSQTGASRLILRPKPKPPATATGSSKRGNRRDRCSP